MDEAGGGESMERMKRQKIAKTKVENEMLIKMVKERGENIEKKKTLRKRVMANDV